MTREGFGSAKPGGLGQTPGSCETYDVATGNWPREDHPRLRTGCHSPRTWMFEAYQAASHIFLLLSGGVVSIRFA